MKIVVKRHHGGKEKSRKWIFTSSHFKGGVSLDDYAEVKWFSVLCETTTRIISTMNEFLTQPG